VDDGPSARPFAHSSSIERPPVEHVNQRRQIHETMVRIDEREWPPVAMRS
jgi:hypothetical protein